MRRTKKIKNHLSHEFELDLAPLLAVMVKLVPVLLVSSAFVQLSIIETDLPQAVKEAIAAPQNDPKHTAIQLVIAKSGSLRVVVQNNGQQKAEEIPAQSSGTFDLEKLQKTLQQVKLQNPEVFKIEFAPDAAVSYKEIVKLMDEARRSRDRDVRFPLVDKATNTQTTTDYMFPDIVFANMMDG